MKQKSFNNPDVRFMKDLNKVHGTIVLQSSPSSQNSIPFNNLEEQTMVMNKTTRPAMLRPTKHKPKMMLELIRILRFNKIPYVVLSPTSMFIDDDIKTQLFFEPFGMIRVTVLGKRMIKATIHVNRACQIIDKIQVFKVFDILTYNKIRFPKSIPAF